MKKLLLTALIMLLCFGAVALADFDRSIWEVFEAGDGFTADFDNDEKEETLHFSTALNEYDDGDFTLTVGDKSVTVKDCIGLEPKVYAMKAGYTWYYYGTVFMVNEYGPSDDPLTYCFLYTEGDLIDIGFIPALVESFDIDSNGVITTRVRANMIGTWYRPTEYVLAVGSQDMGDDWKQIYRLSEVPRTMYPMGMMVTLKKDVKLSSSLYDMDEDVEVKAGTPLIILESDDVSRIFVSDYEGRVKGWLATKSVEWLDYVLIDGSYVAIDEVFDGIFYAD